MDAYSIHFSNEIFERDMNGRGMSIRNIAFSRDMTLNMCTVPRIQILSCGKQG